MYEKLDKLRSDLAKARQRKAEAEAKVKSLEEKLREAENSQVLADVNALKLTPEQVAQFLQMAAAGQLTMAGDKPKASLGGSKTYATEEPDTENTDEGDEDEYEEDYDDEK